MPEWILHLTTLLSNGTCLTPSNKNRRQECTFSSATSWNKKQDKKQSTKEESNKLQINVYTHACMYSHVCTLCYINNNNKTGELEGSGQRCAISARCSQQPNPAGKLLDQTETLSNVVIKSVNHQGQFCLHSAIIWQWNSPQNNTLVLLNPLSKPEVISTHWVRQNQCLQQSESSSDTLQCCFSFFSFLERQTALCFSHLKKTNSFFPHPIFMPLPPLFLPEKLSGPDLGFKPSPDSDLFCFLFF